MTTIDDVALPAADETVRCAVFAEDVGLDPAGTALHADELFVIDVPRAWPKPVWAAEGFTAVPESVLAATDAGRRVKALAAVRDPVAAFARVAVHRRGDDGRFVRTEHRVDQPDVPNLVTALLHDGPDASPTTEVDVAPRSEFLVCTQGSHDVCCGSQGTALVAAIHRARPDVVVTEVSHTGGHRFAPTGVSLPDGRMWARLEVDDVVAVLDRSGSPASLAPLGRGWTGVPAGPAQVAERAVFALVDDWAFDDAARTVVPVRDAGANRWRVSRQDRSWLVDVEVARSVPTIACRKPGGLPAKPADEWRVTAAREESRAGT